ncbi:hypothetical protein HMI54_004058 [Coelomomyces lativittatus]|nr:hypothetical protein HMI54_004058 [Coelomomyces lativittatus]
MSSSTTSKQKRSHASMSSVTSSSIDDVNDSSTSLSHLDLNPTFKKRKARFQLTLLQKSSFWDSSASTFRQWQPPSNPVHQNSLKIVLASLNRFDALLPDVCLYEEEDYTLKLCFNVRNFFLKKLFDQAE